MPAQFSKFISRISRKKMWEDALHVFAQSFRYYKCLPISASGTIAIYNIQLLVEKISVCNHTAPVAYNSQCVYRVASTNSRNHNRCLHAPRTVIAPRSQCNLAKTITQHRACESDTTQKLHAHETNTTAEFRTRETKTCIILFFFISVIITLRSLLYKIIRITL